MARRAGHITAGKSQPEHRGAPNTPLSGQGRFFCLSLPGLPQKCVCLAVQPSTVEQSASGLGDTGVLSGRCLRTAARVGIFFEFTCLLSPSSYVCWTRLNSGGQGGREESGFASLSEGA